MACTSIGSGITWQSVGIAVALGVRATGELRLSGIWISAGLLLGLLIALNKVENDLVHVARHYAGLPQMRDAEEVRAPRGGVLRTARRLAGLVPFHKVFHSVELSILVLIAAIIDLFVAVQRPRSCLLHSSSRPA